MNQTLLPRTDLPEFLTAFATMHDAMCRDAERLVRVAPQLSATDLVPLQRWWARFEATIVHHHEREDELVFPRLEARAPDFDVVHRRLHEDHEALDRAMAAVGAAIGRADLTALRPASVAFREILEDHLGREEATVFPLLAEHFSPDEYAELEKEMQKGLAFGQLAFEMPWALDEASPRVEAMVAELLPAPIRLLNRVVFAPRYRRLTAPLVDVA